MVLFSVIFQSLHFSVFKNVTVILLNAYQFLSIKKNEFMYQSRYIVADYFVADAIFDQGLGDRKSPELDIKTQVLSVKSSRKPIKVEKTYWTL